MSSSISTSPSTTALQTRTPQRAVARESKIPAPLRFPLVAVLSLSISAVLYGFVEDVTGGELAGVSRRIEGWEAVGGLLGWRLFEIGLGWFGDYDGYDIAALTVLSHGPPLYLLKTFYSIRSTTVLTSLAIDLLATYIPFRLLRPLSAAHSSAKSPSLPKSSSEILADLPIQVLETILAASIYSVTLFTSYKTFLPTYLAVYFEGIPSLAGAHQADYLAMLPLALVFGVPVKSFLFTPSVAATPTKEDAQLEAFNPALASLSETLLWNIWGYSTRTRVVIKRTLTLMFVSGVHTFVQTWYTIDGVEALGAAAYSSVWVLAAGITGTALGVISSV